MNIYNSFILTILAGLSTLVGYFILYVKNNKNFVVICSLSFSSGVMFFISLFDLIPESLKLLCYINKKMHSYILFFLIFILGFYLSFFTSKLASKKEKNSLYKVGIVSMVAIIFHNIPEGIATFMASNFDKNLALSLFFSISMHNIPEGISICVPIYYASNNKKTAFLYTLISAFSEPFGALLAFLFLKKFITDTFMGLLLAFIAGIMIYISIFELLPEVKKYNKKILSLIFFVIGMIFMMINIIFM